MTKKELFEGLDEAYSLWLKENRKVGSRAGNALMQIGRILMGKEEIPD